MTLRSGFKPQLPVPSATEGGLGRRSGLALKSFLTGALSRRTRPRKSAGRGRNLLLDLSRVRRLLWVAWKYRLFPLANWLPFGAHPEPFPVRLRLALEEMGLTYLKLGQFLAMRFDILPADVCKELNRLFDRIPGMQFEQVREVVEGEFGQPLEQLYADFHWEPIAAASVAQVHEARLHSGQRVAVKVQRVGLRPIFLADIRNLRRMAAFLDAIGLAGHLSVRRMVDEFTRWTLRELDFTVEGRTADRLASQAEPFVKIPNIYWHLTSPRIMTMEFIVGLSAAQAGDLFAKGGEKLVRTRLANFKVDVALRHFARASLSQLFTFGFFHADAHPGNIFFCDDNIVTFLDFGIFGTLSSAERQIVNGQIINLALGDIVESYRNYIRQLIPTEETDFEAVRRQCLKVLQTWYRACLDPTLPIEERHPAKYIGDMIEVSRQNGLQYCLNYLLFWRALNSLNATAWRVDPRFDLLKELRSYFEQAQPGMTQQALLAVTDRAWTMTNYQLTRALPGQIGAALENASANDQSWHMSAAEGTRRAKAGADRARRLTGAVLLAAAAILLSVGAVTRPVGLALAAALVGGLAVAQWRQS